MFNNVYRLTGIKQIERVTSQIDLSKGEVIVRPLNMAICRADERYYLGLRDAKVLAERLPLALIHEAVGVVVCDQTGTFKTGTLVAMVPTNAKEKHEKVTENYLRSSTFASSTEDGFMRDYVDIEPERLVEIPGHINPEMAAYFEVVSVAVQAVRRLQGSMMAQEGTIGIWGDGNVAYMTAVVAHVMFPDCKIAVFGKHAEKLDYITFADTYLINDVPEDVVINHAIEAVGGRGSEDAINQIIDLIQPCGSVVLSGVSEHPVAINTRMVLEKGIALVGTTRSTVQDFKDAIELVANNPEAQERLELLVQNVRDVREVADIIEAFDSDLNMSWGKTIMRWHI